MEAVEGRGWRVEGGQCILGGGSRDGGWKGGDAGRTAHSGWRIKGWRVESGGGGEGDGGWKGGDAGRTAHSGWRIKGWRVWRWRVEGLCGMDGGRWRVEGVEVEGGEGGRWRLEKINNGWRMEQGKGRVVGGGGGGGRRGGRWRADG